MYDVVQEDGKIQCSSESSLYTCLSGCVSLILNPEKGTMMHPAHTEGSMSQTSAVPHAPVLDRIEIPTRSLSTDRDTPKLVSATDELSSDLQTLKDDVKAGSLQIDEMLENSDVDISSNDELDKVAKQREP